VAHFKAHDPTRVERLWHRIQGYQAMLARFHVQDRAVRARQVPSGTRRRLRASGLAVLGFPVFAYGAVVNALPYFVPRWLSQALARKETDYATVRLLASVVAFPVFWGAETWLVWWLTGPRWAAAFFLSLPVSGLIAYHYLAGLGRLRDRLRFATLALTQRHEANSLLAEREAIAVELERARVDYVAATRRSLA
jgi:glycerol-3-phosphate O-acyltransferase / dihydroxyacetone phosphate acyltransferase